MNKKLFTILLSIFLTCIFSVSCSNADKTGSVGNGGDNNGGNKPPIIPEKSIDPKYAGMWTSAELSFKVRIDDNGNIFIDGKQAEVTEDKNPLYTIKIDNITANIKFDTESTATVTLKNKPYKLHKTVTGVDKSYIGNVYEGELTLYILGWPQTGKAVLTVEQDGSIKVENSGFTETAQGHQNANGTQKFKSTEIIKESPNKYSIYFNVPDAGLTTFNLTFNGDTVTIASENEYSTSEGTLHKQSATGIDEAYRGNKYNGTATVKSKYDSKTDSGNINITIGLDGSITSTLSDFNGDFNDANGTTTISANKIEKISKTQYKGSATVNNVTSNFEFNFTDNTIEFTSENNYVITTGNLTKQ